MIMIKIMMIIAYDVMAAPEHQLRSFHCFNDRCLLYTINEWTLEHVVDDDMLVCDDSSKYILFSWRVL